MCVLPLTWARVASAVALAVSCALNCACFGSQTEGAGLAVTGGDVARGADVIRARDCGTCHVIPGIRGAEGLVGPPLNWMARRTYIAGRLPNRPETMVHWIRVPQEVDPLTAMPNLGLSEQEARDVAAYLYTLR